MELSENTYINEKGQLTDKRISKELYLTGVGAVIYNGEEGYVFCVDVRKVFQ